MPRVSVIIANYNYGRYLAAAVESVLAQSLRDLELIVVDDGSTDDSLAVLQRFTQDDRVRILSVNHLGQSGAKNAGIAAATAPFIAFLDADDVWHPEKLLRQLAHFEGEPRTGVVYSRRTLIDEQGRDLPYRQPALFRGDVLAQMFRNNFVCFSSAVVRTQVLEHIGGFDPGLDLAVDYDLWLRVARHYDFDFVDMPLVQYRVGHGNLSRRVAERLKTALLIMRRALGSDARGIAIDSQVVRTAFAETYANLGLALRPFARGQSGRWFTRALSESPRYHVAWRGLLSLCVPDVARRLLRGRHHWDIAYRSPDNDPGNT